MSFIAHSLGLKDKSARQSFGENEEGYPSELTDREKRSRVFHVFTIAREAFRMISATGE